METAVTHEAIAIPHEVLLGFASTPEEFHLARHCRKVHRVIFLSAQGFDP